MIDFDPATRTFNLSLATSFYAFRIDDADRLLHLAWGACPAGIPRAPRLAGAGFESFPHPDYAPVTRRFEMSTFGDSPLQEVSLKVSFPSLPAGLAAAETRHVPVRDLRLRYVGHDIVTGDRLPDGEIVEPALAPSHGQPTHNTGPRETLPRAPCRPNPAVRCDPVLSPHSRA